MSEESGHLHDGSISDEELNAYVDDQLSDEDRAWMLDAIRRDPELADRACELQMVKQMLRAAYPPPSAPRRSASLSRWRLLTWPQAAAALVLAVVAGALGWGGRAYLLPDHPAGPAASGQLASIAPARRDAKRIVLHVSTDDTGRLKEALDDAEDLLAAYQDSAQPVQIEVVANAEGLALLRADASPFRERIQALSAHHDNIAFLACNRAIEKLHLQGVEVQLLPEARTVPGALEAIVSRLQEGWVYIKV